jgi:hypothetical protein
MIIIIIIIIHKVKICGVFTVYKNMVHHLNFILDYNSEIFLKISIWSSNIFFAQLSHFETKLDPICMFFLREG